MNRLSFVKKIGLLATLCFALGSIWAFGTANGAQQALYSFTVTQEGAVVTGYHGRGYADVTLPATLGEQPVVGIGAGAFWGNGDIRTLHLPSTVKHVESNAFTDCTSLHMVIGDGVASIGDYAFYGCNSLSELVLGDELSLVGAGVFGNAVPSISVGEQHDLPTLMAAYAVVREQNMAKLGRIGNVVITEELLALDNSAARLLNELPDTERQQLWSNDLVEVAGQDGTTLHISFVELVKRLHDSGCYTVMDDDSRAQIDSCIDKLLAELLDDAKRIAG